MLPFSIDELRAAVAAGRVTERPHPTLPLRILNYSPETQYRRDWDDVTLNCRGLILDSEYNIVARPWKKFFNLGEVNLPIQFDDPVEVMDKVDGSLGILYPAGDGWAIATRGSFDSYQARHATEVLNARYAHLFDNSTGIAGHGVFADFVRSYTYLFEIVYPANRIVVDYGDMDDLVLLGAVQTATGYYMGPKAAAANLIWDGPVVEVMPYKTISDAVLGRAGKEGYVIRSHNFLVKVKEPDYVEVHKLVTNASPKTVWAKLAQGLSKSEIISMFPDEFHDYIGSMIDPLLDEYEHRFRQIMTRYNFATKTVSKSKANSVDMSISRRDYAMEFNKWADKKYFFALLDSRPIREILWAELKPVKED